MPSARDGNLTMRLDCSSGTWSHTADQPIPCTCPRKKIGAAADRIEACHQKFMLRRRRKTSQRFSRCSASREPLLSDPNAHGSHPRREAATSCGLSICRRLLYLVWLTLCERLTLVRSVPINARCVLCVSSTFPPICHLVPTARQPREDQALRYS